MAQPFQRGSHTAVVDVKGVIVSGGQADAESIIKSINSAVKDPNTKRRDSPC